MKKSLVLGALLALPLVASAEGLSYNYVQLDWIADSEIDSSGRVDGNRFNAEGDGDGFRLKGVFSVNQNWFVQGSYSDVDHDVDGTIQGFGQFSGSVDTETIRLGVGAHTNAFTGGVDLFGSLNYLNVETGGFDDDGFSIEVGARTLFTNNIEGFISYEYADVGDGDADGFNVGGLYSFTPNWAVGAEYSSGSGDFEDGNDSEDSDTDAWGINVRYMF